MRENRFLTIVIATLLLFCLPQHVASHWGIKVRTASRNMGIATRNITGTTIRYLPRVPSPHISVNGGVSSLQTQTLAQIGRVTFYTVNPLKPRRGNESQALEDIYHVQQRALEVYFQSLHSQHAKINANSEDTNIEGNDRNVETLELLSPGDGSWWRHYIKDVHEQVEQDLQMMHENLFKNGIRFNFEEVDQVGFIFFYYEELYAA